MTTKPLFMKSIEQTHTDDGRCFVADVLHEAQRSRVVVVRVCRRRVAPALVEQVQFSGS